MTAVVPKSISDEADWRQMADWMISVCGLGFHPDTQIGEYRFADGTPVFSSAATNLLQRRLDQAMSVVPEERLYDIAFEVMQRHYPELGAEYR